jgi:hypothetical protein
MHYPANTKAYPSKPVQRNAARSSESQNALTPELTPDPATNVKGIWDSFRFAGHTSGIPHCCAEKAKYRTLW